MKATKKELRERAELILAMEKIARCVNDEDEFMPWLSVGIADGDIDQYTTAEDLMLDDYYMDDKNFSELMGLFLNIMSRAKKNGGLYAGGVVSSDY